MNNFLFQSERTDENACGPTSCNAATDSSIRKELEIHSRIENVDEKLPLSSVANISSQIVTAESSKSTPDNIESPIAIANCVKPLEVNPSCQSYAVLSNTNIANNLNDEPIAASVANNSVTLCPNNKTDNSNCSDSKDSKTPTEEPSDIDLEPKISPVLARSRHIKEKIRALEKEYGIASPFPPIRSGGKIFSAPFKPPLKGHRAQPVTHDSK